jgi:hypothetical protein
MNNTSNLGAVRSTSRGLATRRAASVPVLSGSVAVGAFALGIGDSPASEHDAITGQHCSSTGGGERQCQPRPTHDSALR